MTTFDSWLLGLITLFSVAVAATLVARMLRQGDQTVSLVRTLVAAVLGSALGFFVSIVIQDEWRFWYGCVVEAVTATLTLRIVLGRGDDVADEKDEVARREQMAIESDRGGRANSAITQRSDR